jgi:hypothetical protein
MKTNKSLKDFKIEELEQRLEMDGEWKSNEHGEPTRTEDANGATTLAVVAIIILMIILL